MYRGQTTGELDCAEHKIPKIEKTGQIRRIRQRLSKTTPITPQTDTTQVTFGTPEQTNRSQTDTKNSGLFGKGGLGHICNQKNFRLTDRLTCTYGPNTGQCRPLPVVAESMTDAEKDHILEVARKANEELRARDTSGKVIQNYNKSVSGERKVIANGTSDMKIISNLNSSTER